MCLLRPPKSTRQRGPADAAVHAPQLLPLPTHLHLRVLGIYRLICREQGSRWGRKF